MTWRVDGLVEHGVGRVVAEEPLLVRVPLQFPAHLDGDLPQVAQRRDAVADLGRFERLAAGLHAVDEVLLVGLDVEVEFVGADLRVQDRGRLGLKLIVLGIDPGNPSVASLDLEVRASRCDRSTGCRWQNAS